MLFRSAKGGSLSILAPLVQIGGTTTDPNTLLFAPEFFSAGGFNSFTLRGLGAPGAQPYAFVPGLLIVPGTVIAPRVESRIAEPGADSLSSFIQPDGVRSPVNLSFGAVGIRDGFAADPLVARGDVVVGEGAVIRTEPRGSVTLGGETVAVLGSIIAPGGTIGLSGAANSIGLFTELQRALPTVHVGPHAQLLAQGTTVLTPNAFGYRTGSVLAGGRITLAGNIVAESGAVLDVSGTSDTLDVSPGYLGKGLNVGPVMLGTSFVPTRIDSEGGSIAFTGGQQLISAATLKAFGGGTTASGGSLTISSGRFYSLQTANSAKTPLDVTLSVAQQSIGLSSSFYSGDATAIGHVVLNSQNQPLAGQGYFAADSFAAGGFASLTLRGTVQFNGPVSITANRQIALADRGVLFADNTVQLAAPYIAVGLPFQAPQSITQIRTPYQDGDGRPFNFTPSYGAGNLTLTASSLLDIGPLSLQQIGQATFAAEIGRAHV